MCVFVRECVCVCVRACVCVHARARQGNSIRRVNTVKIDGTSDSLDGDREIKRRLIDRRNMMTRLSWTTSARQLLLQGYGCISSVYISFQVPYASFYAGLACIFYVEATVWHLYVSVRLYFIAIPTISQYRGHIGLVCHSDKCLRLGRT